MARVLTEDRLSRPGGAPLKVAIAVAVLGVLGMLIVDHGPWNKPQVQPAFMASYSSTGEAARAAGAKVMPTESKLQVEPEPPMPKPVHPVNRRRSKMRRLTCRANHRHSGFISKIC